VTAKDLVAAWPLFGLRITTPRLELVVPTDDLYAEVCDVARAGVHPPDFMPFSEEWTDAPADEVAINSLQFLWSTRASWRPSAWHLEFAVLVDGRPVGMQGIWSSDFQITREFFTGAWLGMAHQSQGFGTEMRAAVLHFCFACLEADSALSNFYDDNEVSRSLNRRHGYRDDGHVIRSRRGKPARWNQQRVSRAEWLGVHPSDAGIAVSGWDEARRFFLGD